MKKNLCIILFSIVFTISPSLLQAKKFKFSLNKKHTKPKTIESFVSRYGDTNKAKKIPERDYCPGQKVYFYYKIGPVQSVKGKGMPFKTKMIISLNARGKKYRKDLGWHSGNGVPQNKMNKTQVLGYYHSARWNLTLSEKYPNGSIYKVTVFHHDLNSNKVLKFNYKLMTQACN